MAPQNWNYRAELGLYSTYTTALSGNFTGVPKVAVVVIQHLGLGVKSDI